MENIFIFVFIFSLNGLAICQHSFENYLNYRPTDPYKVHINHVMPIVNPNYRAIQKSPKNVLSARMLESTDCKDSNAIEMSISQVCSLPPDRGHGHKDVIRIYYDAVLQQCLPFSWSGKGGNVNRFVSVKNCYEICHPSEPSIRKLTESGARPYLGKLQSPKYCNSAREGISESGVLPIQKERSKVLAPDVVIRQINNPLSPDKTLTLIQPVKYINEEPTTRTERPKIIIEKRIRHVPVFVMATPYSDVMINAK